MQTDSWRANSYQFCGHGCLGLVAVNFFDTYSTAVNGDYHQVQNGSCRNTFSLNESGRLLQPSLWSCLSSSEPASNSVPTAWERLYASPPTQLVQDYFKCKNKFQDNVINAIGVGSGTAGAIIPVGIFIIAWIIGKLGFEAAELREDLYTEEEMSRATKYWATHLLILRDIEGNITQPQSYRNSSNLHVCTNWCYCITGWMLY